MFKKRINKYGLPVSVSHCLLLILEFCISGFWGIVQITVHKQGPPFICLAKNLQILRDDKNGLHYICLGWNLQTLESDQTFSVPSIKELIFAHCNFHGSECSHILWTIYLVNLSVGWLFFFFFLIAYSDSQIFFSIRMEPVLTFSKK